MTSNLLTKHRQLAGLTLAAVAKVVGVDPSRVSVFENGRSIVFNRMIKYALTFSTLYGCTIEELFRPQSDEVTARIKPLKTKANQDHMAQERHTRKPALARKTERILSISVDRNILGLFITDGREELFSDVMTLGGVEATRERLSKLIRDWHPVGLVLNKLGKRSGDKQTDGLVNWLRITAFRRNLKFCQYSEQMHQDFFVEKLTESVHDFSSILLPLVFPELKRFVPWKKTHRVTHRRRVSLFHAAAATKIFEDREMKKRFRFKF